MLTILSQETETENAKASTAEGIAPSPLVSLWSDLAYYPRACIRFLTSSRMTLCTPLGLRGRLRRFHREATYTREMTAPWRDSYHNAGLPGLTSPDQTKGQLKGLVQSVAGPRPAGH